MITEELKLGEIGPSWGLLYTLQEVLIIEVRNPVGMVRNSVGTGIAQEG